MNFHLKKLMMSALAITAMGLTASAQMLQVESIKKVPVPKGTIVYTATVSPDGSYVIYSDATKAGLSKLDLATGKSSQFAAKGDGLDVKISADGQEVLFREYTTDANRLVWSSLKSKNVKTQKEQVIVAKSRDIHGFVAHNNKALAVDKRNVVTKKISSSQSDKKDIVPSIIDGQLCVTQNGSTRNISPQGRGSYLWPELSPDGKRIVYFLRGTGCYVCDLNGKNVRSLGYYHAAKWLDNSTVVAMDDYDNGVVTVKSSIVAINVNTAKAQTLTPSSIVATFPSPAKNKITFITPKGELYNINLK